MKKIIALMLFLTFFAHANDSEPGSQYLKAAEAGDRRAQYFLADSWFSSGDLSKAEYWAQKAADSGDADACALLAQIKITNPVSLDYPQAKVLAEKAAQAGSKEGEVTLAHILVNTQAGKPDYPKAISLLENASEDLENDSAVDAQMLLGLIYANGVGIKADDDKATWYFKRSSAISRTALDFGPIDELRKKHGDLAAVAPLPRAHFTKPNIVIKPNANSRPTGDTTGYLAN
uniref:tetratricopeptide repeat protein n=1 Tax=Escherichia coli TaxID=562 RepID=UPI000A69487F